MDIDTEKLIIGYRTTRGGGIRNAEILHLSEWIRVRDSGSRLIGIVNMETLRGKMSSNYPISYRMHTKPMLQGFLCFSDFYILEKSYLKQMLCLRESSILLGRNITTVLPEGFEKQWDHEWAFTVNSDLVEQISRGEYQWL